MNFEGFEIFVQPLWKFVLVGLVGVVINFGLTFIQKELFDWNKYIANTNAYILAILANFVLNRYWTFSAQDHNIQDQFFRFILIAGIATIMNHCIVFMFHQKFKVKFYCSKAIAVCVIFVWNFMLHSLYTFV